MITSLENTNFNFSQHDQTFASRKKRRQMFLFWQYINKTVFISCYTLSVWVGMGVGCYTEMTIFAKHKIISR